MSVRSYFRVQPGGGNKFATDFFREGFIGIDFLEHEDLTAEVAKGKTELKDACEKIFADKTDVYKKGSGNSIGRACAKIVTFCKDIKDDDVVLCPDTCGNYAIGIVKGGYKYEPDRGDAELPPHRRAVEWHFDKGISSRDLIPELQKYLSVRGTIVNLTENYAEIIEEILAGKHPKTQIHSGYIAETEEKLEEKLCEHWAECGLEGEYELLAADDELMSGAELNIHKNENYEVGRQVQTNAGNIDLLAIDKTRTQLLVIELKQRRGYDEVVGQILRYMGCLKNELKNANRAIKVKGCIITYGESRNILYALDALEKLNTAQPEDKFIEGVDFYRYVANQKDLSDLKLVKVEVTKTLEA